MYLNEKKCVILYIAYTSSSIYYDRSAVHKIIIYYQSTVSV